MSKIMHVLSNTHWDREHRHSFQETRLMLVKLMDSLIEIMENDPEYVYYTLDGQVIILHDYLEVRPQMRSRLEKLIKDGRILIGPWYTLADCYSVNAESVVRNLLMGHKVCKEFGVDAMKAGYSIFSFGQIAQLPQIYKGFGIDDIVFYKGASDEKFPKSEFFWKAPDGTKAFTTKLGKEKRWNFYAFFSIPVILGGHMMKPGWSSSYNNGAKLCHLISDEFANEHAIELEPDIRIRTDKIAEAINDVMDSVVEPSAAENVFLGFEGTDFTAPLKEMPEALKIANEIMDEKVEFIHSNIVEYFKQVKKDIDLSSLIEYEGEMRFGPVSHVHSETMGSNVDIKQLSFKAENLLLNYAEPLTSMQKMLGGGYDEDMFNLAWRYLLSSQAHDSIHGAGVPKIKTDTLNRLEQVTEIATSLTRRAVEGVASLIDTSDSENIRIAVFNTTPYERSEVIKVSIDLPDEDLVKDYWIEDNEGNRIQSYHISARKKNHAMIHPQNRAKTIHSDRMEVNLLAENIPAMGYKLFSVKCILGNPNENANPFPQGSFAYKPIGQNGSVMDNGLIRVSANTNGSIDVYDYKTGKQYTQLNYFEDTGCSGDFWVHREPVYNELICSLVGGADVSIIENNGLMATMRVKKTLNIPSALSEDRMKRNNDYIPLEIVSDITVKKNSSRIDFKTTVKNNAKDHMLTVSFPTGIDTEYANCECPFEIRKKAVDDVTDDFGKRGPELQRYTFHNFVDISEKCGITLMTRGLKEVGTSVNSGAVMNLTLLRAVTGTFPVHNDLFFEYEKETSQCIGTHVFEYALFLHDGDYKKAKLIEESRKYIVPVIAAQIGKGEKGMLKDTFCMMSFKNDKLAVASMKLSEDGKGIVVRLNNMIDEAVEETVTLFKKFKKIYEVSLDESKRELLAENTDTLSIKVSPYKIYSLYIEL